jgi:hypothetical protein
MVTVPGLGPLIGDLISALCSALGIDIVLYDIIAAIGTLLCIPFSVHEHLFLTKNSNSI